ncbi:MAG: dimethylargininase [Gemmatimonadota bacterium]
MLIALTRPVSPSINSCELTHLTRAPIDLALAQAQHESYERTLKDLGCQVQRVQPAPELPDAVFVEDSAVVLDEIGIVTRPGAPSRRPETALVAEALRPLRLLRQIEEPGTLDGGDVLRIKRTLYVGRSGRTNDDGIAQLERFAAPFGYAVKPVETTGCLHLKTAVTEVGEGTLLLNPRWVDPALFADFKLIQCDPTEPFAANALRIGDSVLHAAAWERTRERLERAGIAVVPVEASELAKAEAGVTCCSVVFEA